jgi:hypothetical protein
VGDSGEIGGLCKVAFKRLCVVGVLAALLPLQAGSSMADEPTVAFVSPDAGSDVSGTVEVTVQSSGSDYVRVGMAEYRYDWLPPLAVGADGLTTVEVPSWGYWSLGLRAQNCATADPASCSEPTASRRVWGYNGYPELVQPSSTVFTRPAHDGTLSVRVTGDGPGLVRVGLSGRESRPSVIGEKDTEIPLDLSQYGNGTYEVHGSWCNPVVPAKCDPSWSLGTRVIIRHDLPAEVTYDPVPVSPNGDGRHDLVNFSAAGDPDYHQEIRWRLFRSAKPLTGWRIANVGYLGGRGWSPLPEEFAIDLFADLPRRSLASAPYQLALRFTRDLGGHHYRSRTDLPVVVDVTPVSVSKLRASRERFHPKHRDGYRDAVWLRGSTTGGKARTISVLVLDRRGTAIRHLEGTAARDGLRAVRWAGRKDDGRLAAPGRYRFRVVTFDDVGNRAVTTGAAVRLSHARR